MDRTDKVDTSNDQRTRRIESIGTLVFQYLERARTQEGKSAMIITNG